MVGNACIDIYDGLAFLRQNIVHSALQADERKIDKLRGAGGLAHSGYQSTKGGELECLVREKSESGVSYVVAGCLKSRVKEAAVQLRAKVEDIVIFRSSRCKLQRNTGKVNYERIKLFLVEEGDYMIIVSRQASVEEIPLSIVEKA